MVKGSSKRRADWPVNPIFVDRWSARAMSGEALTEAELMPLLEAARWAPSSMNYQPWRLLYALRGSEWWDLYLSLLFEGNRAWAQQAGALVVFVSHTVRDTDGKPCLTHSYDTGAAWQNFALQASLSGLVNHGIQGFDYQRARTLLRIPADFNVEAMAVVGKPGDVTALPDNYRQRETPNDRRPLSATARAGAFDFSGPQ